MKRSYTTWEEDFVGNRCEFHGYHEELVAVIDTEEGSNLYCVRNAAGFTMLTGMKKKDAMRAAESLLDAMREDT